MPLTQELVAGQFSTALRAHPAATALVAELRRAIGNPDTSLEAELQRLSTEADERALLRRQILSFQLYLQSVIASSEQAVLDDTAGVTSYVDLLQELERWRFQADTSICLVTFNYDTLIEQALKVVLGISIDSMADYVGHDSWKLIKVHGSTSWYQRVDGVDWNRAPYASDEVIPESYDVISIDPEILGPGDTRSITRETNHHYVPALAIPTLGKGTFVCPNDHLAALRAGLTASDSFLIIGWRGADEHFLRFWADAVGTGASTTPRLFVVDRSGADAMPIAEHVSSASLKVADVRPAKAGFVESLANGDITRMLWR